jgi:hypothetical protein
VLQRLYKYYNGCITVITAVKKKLSVRMELITFVTEDYQLQRLGQRLQQNVG